MSFSDKLADARKSYPFETWAARFGRGLDQYTPENVGLAKAIMDNLIVSLLAVGDEASDEVKISLIKENIYDVLPIWWEWRKWWKFWKCYRY